MLRTATSEEFLQTFTDHGNSDLKNLVKAIRYGFKRTPTIWNKREYRFLKDRIIRRSIERSCQGWDVVLDTTYGMTWHGVRILVKLQRNIWPYFHKGEYETDTRPLQLKNPHENDTTGIVPKTSYVPFYDILMAMQPSIPEVSQPFAVGFMSADYLFRNSKRLVKRTPGQFKLYSEIDDWDAVMYQERVTTNTYSETLSLPFETGLDNLVEQLLNYED